jgi:SAM-dependent methyltransferase
VALLSSSVLLAQSVRYFPFPELSALVAQAGVATPADLQLGSGPQAEARWLAWIGGRDRAIRGRLAEGDRETLVNWVLLGTSFTAQPPIRLGNDADDRAVNRSIQAIRSRVDDVIGALAAPGNDERRIFARRFLEAGGMSFASPASRSAARDDLLRMIQTALGGSSDIFRRADGPRQGAAAGAAGSEFQQRGLSLDTSLAPNFALHDSLAALKARGVLDAGSIRRVAIVGAGLDFADKNTGFDFYPVQTLQPFAVLDSLRQLDLAPATGRVEIVALDISPRVLDHVRRIRTAGGTYTLQLPLSRHRPWLPAFRAYWEILGRRIGTDVAADVPDALADEAELRAIRVNESALGALSAEDVNIIVARPVLPAYDLVIATNVLLYYGPFDQALAIANIGAALRPGGLLLTNTNVSGVSEQMRRIGSRVTLYTRDNTGDEIQWYQRAVDRPTGAR